VDEGIILTDRLDGYEQFFQIFPREEFIEFGLKNIISVDGAVAVNEWKTLVDRVHRQSPDLYVRDFGRNGNGNSHLSQLYKDVFGITVNYDTTNNHQPTRLIQKLTGHRKNKTIFNYQVSHVFGHTKNVFCFTAPWNIVFIPKIIDPFTGHEAKGDYVEEFSKRFRMTFFRKFEEEITEYNQEIDRIRPEIERWIELAVPDKHKRKYLKEFEEIRIEYLVRDLISPNGRIAG